MPKISETISSKVPQYVNKFPNAKFKSDGQVLLCVAYKKININESTVFNYTTHYNTKTQRKIARKNANKVFSRQHLHLVIVSPLFFLDLFLALIR